MRGVQDIRILYAFDGEGIVLLHGFIKKAQKISRREIEAALGKLKQLDL